MEKSVKRKRGRPSLQNADEAEQRKLEWAKQYRKKNYVKMCHIMSLPEHVLVQILSHLPAKDFIAVFRLVCRQWKEIVDGSCLWKEKCQREGFMPNNIRKFPKDWRAFYILTSKKRNLIKNPCGENYLDNWQVTDSEGNPWHTESLPGFYRTTSPDEHVKKYFVTSYHYCEKQQLIDLKKEGYWPQLLDDVNPAIVVTDWYAAWWNCCCRYDLHVQLLSEDQEVIQEFHPETVVIEKSSDVEWKKMTHTFKNYGPGVRYVRFVHGGIDTQYWAGYYGIQVTNSSVVIEPETLI